MTRFEYLQLRGMIESSYQRKLGLLASNLSFWLILILSASGVGIFIPGSLKGIMLTDFINQVTLSVIFFYSSVVFFIAILFYCKNFTNKEEESLCLVKLGESWEQKKTVEETLALPEFAKLFPEKPRVGGIEFV